MKQQWPRQKIHDGLQELGFWPALTSLSVRGALTLLALYIETFVLTRVSSLSVAVTYLNQWGFHVCSQVYRLHFHRVYAVLEFVILKKKTTIEVEYFDCDNMHIFRDNKQIQLKIMNRNSIGKNKIVGWKKLAAQIKTLRQDWLIPHSGSVIWVCVCVRWGKAQK